MHLQGQLFILKRACLHETTCPLLQTLGQPWVTCMQVHGLHGDSGCLASVEPAPGADQAAFRAAATVLAHLRNGPSLCSLLGLPVDPGLDPCTSQDDLAHALSPLGPDAIGKCPYDWIGVDKSKTFPLLSLPCSCLA
jgi:hypothetical protein